MKEKIIDFGREYITILSSITIIIGLFLLFMGMIHYWFANLKLGFYTELISNLQEWNAYALVAGLILLAIGGYYIYLHVKDKKFVLEELRTNKRSELLKKHAQLRMVAKHLPSKYQKMLQEKEKELNIK